MKRCVTFLALCLLVAMMPLTMTSAATAAASVTGPSVLRAGDTFKVAVLMTGTGLRAAQGTITYDATKLVFQGSDGVLTGWAIDIGSATAGKVTFLGVDDKLTAPINSSKQLFTLTFQVKSGVATGANIAVTATKLSASDGTNDFSPGDASYSVNVAAPASSNNALATLTASNATLSPAFSAATTSYTASVPFETAKLSIQATAADTKAKVVVGNTSLAAGKSTDVTITVTAENGAKKVYTIRTTRAQDPNYSASTVSTLSSLAVDGFLLSPAFNAEDVEYVVWLPTEVESIALLATTTDPKASVEITGNEGLLAGQDNAVTVLCRAEDGKTTTEYKVIAWRAPAHDSADPTPTTEPSPAVTMPETSGTPAATPTTDPGSDKSSGNAPVLPIAGAGAVGIVIGLGGSLLVRKRK